MIPAIGALLLTRSLPRITEFEDLFQQMSIPEIVKFIEGHIRDKNPTTLYYICHIPDQKLERITEIEGFSEALRLCEKDDHIRLFFEVATPKKLTVLTHLPIGGESLMKILKLPIQKANHPLSKECRQKIILLPPLALLIAWQADMPIFFLSKYFSPKQLRFMARYAPSRFVEQMIDFFKSENFSVKLYTLLNALPADVADAFSTGSYTLKQYSIRFNEDIDIQDRVPKHLIRDEAAELPEVAELDLVRHYTALSNKNHGLDNGFYPLGSCATTKYNPKINEVVARLSGLSRIHPYQPTETVQGALEILYNLQEELAVITGMDAVTLQPSAGAQGEWTGLMMIKAYHEQKGEKVTTIL